MINQEKRNDIAHRRLNQFMQDGKALDYLHNIANIEINKITLENKDKNESASTCHSERTSRWTNNDVKVETSSRKNRYQRAVEREKFSRNLSKKYEDFNSISPSKSACNSNHIINDNEIFDQNISIKEMFNFRDLKNEEGMISIIKEKFNQIIRDLKDTYLSNANRFLVRENFLELKRKFTNNPKQHEQLITEFFNKNIKDINDIFYQLEECYFSTIKSPEFIEKLIGPISKFFEEKNININFENVLKEEFFNIILNDEFFKEIIEEIEKRDLIILAKIKSLIKNIKEEFLQKHSEKIFLESPLIFNCSYKSKIEIVSNSTNTNNTISYTKATTIHNKISRESKIVSPVNYTLKSIPSNNSQNENDYKNINDWVEYINSENNIKNKKNKKKNNFSKKNNKTNNKNSVSNAKSDNNLIDKSEINEIDSEIEEFKRKISNESIKANLIEKIKPRFTEKWIKLLISYLDN